MQYQEEEERLQNEKAWRYGHSLWDGAAHMQGPDSVLWEVRMVSSWQSARKWEPQSYKWMELHSTNNLNELGSKIVPRAHSKKSGPANTFILALWDTRAEKPPKPLHA